MSGGPGAPVKLVFPVKLAFGFFWCFVCLFVCFGYVLLGFLFCFPLFCFSPD